MPQTEAVALREQIEAQADQLDAADRAVREEGRASTRRNRVTNRRLDLVAILIASVGLVLWYVVEIGRQATDQRLAAIQAEQLAEKQRLAAYQAEIVKALAQQQAGEDPTQRQLSSELLAKARELLERGNPEQQAVAKIALKHDAEADPFIDLGQHSSSRESDGVRPSETHGPVGFDPGQTEIQPIALAHPKQSERNDDQRLLLSSSLTAGDDAVYRAVIDGHINALISVQTNDGKITGTIYYDVSGADGMQLTGKPGAPGSFKWEEALDKPTGAFEGTLAPDGKTGQGTWTSANGKKRLEITLSRVATIQNLEDGKIKASVSYPRLDDPRFARLNERLAADAKKKFAENVALMKDQRTPAEDQRSDPDMAEMIEGMSAETGCDIGSVTQDIVSVLCATWEFTGGAHGNTYKEAVNYHVAPDGAVRPFGLWDALQKSPANVNRLSRIILADLKRQGASNVDTQDPGKMSIDNFAGYNRSARTGKEKIPSFAATIADSKMGFNVIPAGLAFDFDPYEVGSWADGSFRVVVPNSKLAPLYRRDGPLADRADASQPAGQKTTR